jgi:hypothetical protein
MDSRHFDHLTRLLGAQLNRRTGLGLLTTAGVIGRSPLESIAGKKKGNGKKKKKIVICHQAQTLTVKKRGWQRHYPGALQGECSPLTSPPSPLTPPAECSTPNCGAGCCSQDGCFVATARPNEVPTEFGCCPADKICLSPRTDGFFPDQCCYSDEFCDPDRVDPASPRHDFAADSLCCRSCVGNTTCCPYGFYCSETDQCEILGTARLPRTRRA